MPNPSTLQLPSRGGGLRQGGFTATSRQEFIADISLTTPNTVYQLPTNGGLIPNDRYIFALILTFEGRMTNPASNGPTGVLADAPWSLIENITVQGYHRVRAQNEPFINIRGVDLYNLLRCYNPSLCYCEPNDSTLVKAGIYVPNLSVAASATNDIRFTLYLPFYPLNLPIGQQLGYLLDAPNYDRLQLSVTFSDQKSVFSGQTTQPTFSAYGSASGSPRLRVEGQFALGGSGVFGYVPGRVWRYFVENTTGDITGTVTNSRQYNVPRGNRIRSVMIKTGTKSTGVTAGNNAYSSYSDTVFTNIKFQRGLNKSIRFYPSFYSIKFETQQSYGSVSAVGHALIDFAQRGRINEALDTVGLIAGPSGDTDVFIQADVAGGSNMASLFLVEELRNIPRYLTR